MIRRSKAPSVGSNQQQGSRLALTAALALFASLVLGVSLAAAIAPTVTVEDASGVDAFGAHVEGEVDPQDKETSYHLEVITDAKFQENLGNALPGFQGATGFGHGGPLAPGSGPHAVEVDTPLLQPNTTYHLRLVAQNDDGPAEDVAANFTTPVVAPTLSKPGHTQLGQGAVVLSGYVNPRNLPITACQFEYGPDESYGQVIPCESLPATSNQPTQVRAQVGGLTLGATYHYRFSATSTEGTTDSEDAILTVHATLPQVACPNPSAPGLGFLPHCRAWEMVSPQDKNGGNVVAMSSRTRAASVGSALTFSSLQGFADAHGSGISFEYMAQRSSDPDPGNQGWSTHGITPPQQTSAITAIAARAEPIYQGYFSEDLSKAVFRAYSPLTDAPLVANALNLYLRDDMRTPGTGSYELLTDSEEPPFDFFGSLKQPPSHPVLAGSSRDFGHVIFESPLKLLADPGLTAGTRKLFEWDHGTVRPAGILPDGKIAEFSIAGRMGSSGGQINALHHPISDDGSRIVFVQTTSAGGNTGRIFSRIEGRSTIQLNASERTPPAATEPAAFWDASTDGSRVFFETTEPLTDDTPAGSTAILYMWEQQETDEEQSVAIDASSGTFTLSFHGKTTPPIAFNAGPEAVDAALEALITVKSDNVSVSGGPGSPGAATPYEVTFTGDFAGANVAQLSASGAGLGGGTATVTTTTPVENLTLINADGEPADARSLRGVIGASDDGDYVYFVSTGQLITGKPVLGGDMGIYVWHEGVTTFIGRLEAFGFASVELFDTSPLALVRLHTEVTPDGRHVLFPSSSGEGLLSERGGVDYDHGDCSALNLPACRELYLYSAETDELDCVSCNPSGEAAKVNPVGRVSALNGALGALSNYLTRLVSDDGRYAFFSTAERLVHEDRNGISDAYVYDNQTDEPRLLSSGESLSPSYFLDASADGKDAFIATAEPLVGWDVDNAFDLYDARVDGGFPEPPPPPPSCQGDACQPAPPNLSDPTPSSSSFQGAGDPEGRKPRPRCPKGRHRVNARGGKSRCVKRSTSKKRDAKSNRRAGR